MNSKLLLSVLTMLFLLPAFISCEKDNKSDSGRIEVILNDIPYKTGKYLRLGYMLKTWEYEKEGFQLQRIIVLDNDTKSELMNIGKADLPRIYKEPLKRVWPFISYDKITGYYLSIQLPIPLGNKVPTSILNRFILTDTINNREVTVEGGLFNTRKDETPRAIASPVKGTNLIFANLSTMGYHFDEIIFYNGQMNISERYAFDVIQTNDQGEVVEGDPTKNESFFCYADTLYAVANGTVANIVDGRPEQAGIARTVPLNSIDELFGNYIVLDIGNGCFAGYMHCIPGSFFLKNGAIVKEGQPVALLGNSGNSTFAHLHFQLCDNKDINLAKGVPVILKKFTKTGEFNNPAFFSPVIFTNALVEDRDILTIE